MTIKQLRHLEQAASEVPCHDPWRGCQVCRHIYEAREELERIHPDIIGVLLDVSEAAKRCGIECSWYDLIAKRCLPGVCPRCDLRDALTRLEEEADKL